MTQFIPPNYTKIIERWQQAGDDLARWHAISEWLMFEYMRCYAVGYFFLADPMRTLSDLARQRALDLQPMRELEAA